MASPSQNFTPRLYHGVGPPLPAGLALALYGLAVAVFFTIGTLGAGLAPTIAGELVGFAAVPLLAVHVHGARPTDLGLVRPPLLTVVGAIVSGLFLWIVAMHVAAPIIEATHREHAAREVSDRLLARDTALPLVLVANALVPGLSEELLHRGLVLGALAPRLGRAGAVIVTALLFGLLHIEPARMAAAALLGLVAGTLAVWSRSVWPAVALHITNNAIALMIGADVWPRITAAIEGQPGTSLGVAIAGSVAGLGIAWIGRQQA